ncbi:polymorphic toxin-type HINT domain-containing protein [Micromonospora sp. NBC_01699]|uniref:polymorphic toxin-type HINT domain-containing protein n=1 Tax=Micromonospora sp. NBC_01699 TaxID=2975984 RepID=UPI002E347131|nr:polymorphic toxin-type HINT domain-containing protein [Micromonospora sp. NBC_01699]
MSLLHAPAPAAASADPPYQPPAATPVPAVPVTEVAWAPVSAYMPSQLAASKRQTLPGAASASAKPAPVWPAAASTVVELAAAQDSAPAKVGGLPVRVAAANDSGTARSTTGQPQRVRVEVLDRAATTRAGVRGVLLRLHRADGLATTAGVRVSVDYAAFATAYGADWASRLRLVSLPDCALTSPNSRQCVGVPLPSRNDLAKRTVSADLPLSAAARMVALSADTSGPAGDYGATSLQPSSTWSAGGNSGSFTWSYPMRVPPAPGGPAPQIGLNYSSQSVDGRHAASNNQPSWVGEGFEATVGGFIERRYKPCADDMDGSANNDDETGDLCWETDNAILSLNGSSSELIYNSTENRWHPRSDDGSRIERRTGASNGDNNGEHWVVTATDGTQYWFGRNRLPGWASGQPVTNSTWTAPVFGNDPAVGSIPAEPCHATAFADSDCVQAWRWNLDYVVDLNNNSASYWYVKETNKYARNLDPADDAAYDRGGWLDRIDYGTRQNSGVDSVLSTPAPLRVEFGEADRCLSSCGTHDEAHWPDTPWDAECTGTSCPDNFSPTFWSTKRLATITTQVRNGGGYDNVERWTLKHTFPDPGDGTRAGLWLDKISHAGLVGGTTTVPDVEFTYIQLANRVDTIDFAAAMNWMRIAQIRNESGGTINVTYSEPDCVAGQTPTPHTNNRLCYPVIWEPEGYQDPVTDWFHKYVVTTIYEIDHTGGVPPKGSPRVVHSYQYFDGVAWHYNDDDGLVDPKRKTWSDYRGYGRVAVTVGDPGDQTYTETRYFRGMHGDKLSPSGGTRPVTIDGINDEDWYAGIPRETKTLNGPGGAVVSRQTNDPWASGATATRTVNGDTVTARHSRVATVRDYTMRDAGRGERVTRTTTGYDSYGMPISVDDFGEESVAGDETCAKTDFTPRNDTAWVMDRVHRTQTYAIGCAATTGTLTEADVIGETRTWYDDQPFETAPTRGLPTTGQEMGAWNAGAPTFTTIARTAYDVQGRVTSSWDAMDSLTKTDYVPVTGGPVTGTTVTNPLLHVTTTTLQPAWGLPTSTTDANNKRTDLAYDGLGRLTSVWLPGRDKTTQTANMVLAYTIRNNAATAVTTSQLNAAGNYITSHAFYDGQLRPRQTQVPSPSGGRMLTEAFYDSAGRARRTYGTYHANGSPGMTLVTATEPTNVPNQTRTIYDGAGRATAAIFQPYTVERWRGSTYYAGDRVDDTPPAGGTAMSTVFDARGRTVGLRQYHGTAPTPNTAGSWDATSYTFNRKGQLTSVTDPAGNDWTYTYDIRGRQIQVSDPDKGSTSLKYDNAGRVTETTDARNKRLLNSYDKLNRRTAILDPAVPATRARWTYDTIDKGQLTQSTRIVGTATYTVSVTDYDDAYRPTGQAVTIPATETGLSGTYNFTSTWNIDGSPASTSLPSINAGLPDEILSYGYDSLGLPTTLTTLYGNVASSYVAGTDYNALGQAEQYELYTGSGGRVWQKFERELETGRLTGIRTDRDTVAPHILSDIRYSFDPAGNITKATDVAPDPVDDTQCFDYDHLRRLTEAWTPASGNCEAAPSTSLLGGPAPYRHSWTFNAVGNRLSQVVHSTSGNATTNYAYPPADSPRPHSLSSTSGAQTGTYTYDATGNTLTRPTSSSGTQTMTWDPEGHLETSTDTAGETRYIYDADGNRLIRRDPTGKTLYLPGQEIRYTGTGSTNGTRYYSHGGAVVASRNAAGLTWLTSDHQGTGQIAVTADNTQALTLRRQTPYGTPRGPQLVWPNQRGFVGGTQDPTGLTHLGAREYDSGLGRFISVDPIMDLKDPQQWNAYSYANNTPITSSDPSGLSPEDAQWGGPTPSKHSQVNTELRYGSGKSTAKTKDKDRDFGRDVWRGVKSGWSSFVDSTIDAVTLQSARDAYDSASATHGQMTGVLAFAATVVEPLTPIGQFKMALGQADTSVRLIEAVADGDTEEAAAILTEQTLTVGAALLPLKVAPKGVRPPVTGKGRGGSGCSFSGQTGVLLADGSTKPIEEIAVGDVVLATDPETGEEGPRRVTQVWSHEDDLIDLKLDDDKSLTTTEDHPFWNATDRQWQEAQQLDTGDMLHTSRGTELPVVGLDWRTAHRGAAFNLTIDDIHTYYVMAGNTPVLVHNTGGCINFVSKGAGLDLRRSAEIDGETWRFNTGHGFNRAHEGPSGMNDLRTTTLTADQIEAAIARDVNAFRVSGGQIPVPGTSGFRGPLERYVDVGGAKIGYRVTNTPDGAFNVPTYWNHSWE